ncbi:MAG: glycosyltransferase [Treponema sp.]|nr:glycosyltransferase [Treponema sp.]
MNIGFFIKWDKDSFNSKGNVIGDELLGLSMIKYLRKIPGVTADLYAPNWLPKIKLDVMIYLNDTPPNNQWAEKHVLYLQNAYLIGGDTALKQFSKIGYSGFLFYSKKLFDMHKESGGDGIYLPFGVDVEEFYPRQPDSAYIFDCAYIGNDIKGKERTERFIIPAMHCKFGLYGNWPKYSYTWKQYIKILLGIKKRHETYQQRLGKISKGKIPQEDVPKLYSSAKINLNCTAQDCVDMDVITLRTFEVLACKGFLITDKVPLAEELLAGCVVFTDGGKDLRKKIKYYLKHENEMQDIAERGYQYVVKHATIEAQVNKLYDYLMNLS